MAKKIQRMEVLGRFRPEDVLPYITRFKERREYKGADGRTWNVKMCSNRYFTFRESLSCVVCGLKGTVMSLERSVNGREQPHFNLYASVSIDEWILMTKDHIEPKSLGGKDAADNFQTMCSVCNGLKSDHRLSLSQMKLLRAKYDLIAVTPLTDVDKMSGPKELHRTIAVMAGRMAADNGDTPMLAGELAKLLLLTPDAVVAVRDSVGCDRVAGLTESKRGVTDSDRLPTRFIVIE